jgi:maltose O-acetyltransferase
VRHFCLLVSSALVFKGMKVTIREAKEEEASQLTEVAVASKKYWDYPDDWFELWEDILEITSQTIRQLKVWVAEENTRAIGFVGIGVESGVAELEHLWVLPGFINKGIGNSLFNTVVDYCRSNGITQIRIESDPNAKAFYEKMGARLVGYVESKPAPRKLPVLLLKIES